MDKLDSTVQIWFVGVHTPELDRRLLCNSGDHSAKNETKQAIELLLKLSK